DVVVICTCAAALAVAAGTMARPRASSTDVASAAIFRVIGMILLRVDIPEVMPDVTNMSTRQAHDSAHRRGGKCRVARLVRLSGSDIQAIAVGALLCTIAEPQNRGRRWSTRES